MEKKNTILLTVIAVATLLVAVVGATFAYYSIQSTANFNSTSINATVKSPGLVTAGTTTENLKLNLTAIEMEEKNAGIYYAVTKDSGVEFVKETAQSHTILPATLTPGTDDQKTYTCTGTLTVNVDASEESVESGVAALKFTPKDGVVTMKATGEESPIDGSLEITGDINNKVYDLTYKLGPDNLYGDIKVDFSIVNKSELQGKIGNFDITLTPSALTCTMDEE